MACFAVEHLALCQQQILRGFRVEAGLFTTALDYCLEQDGRTFRPMSENLVGHGDIEITRAQNRNFAAGEGMRRMVKDSDVWTILLRYKINAERQDRRAVEDFERLKRMRPEMPNHPDVGTAPDVIDDIAPLKEINPMIRLEPDPCEVEPAAAPVEPSNVGPDASEDGAPLAPAAASSPKTQEPTSRIPGSAVPEAGRFKTKPFASPLRRPNNRRPVTASKTRHPACSQSPLFASVPRRPACRPLANPAASHHPETAPPDFTPGC